MERIRIFDYVGDEGVLSVVRDSISETYGCAVEESKDLPLFPIESLNNSRGQHDAGRIVEFFQRYHTPAETLLVITDKDLYVPNLNYVFGLAHSGVAIISLLRLNPTYYKKPANPEILRLRTRKEACHEVGHLLGLAHCENPLCVMHFSNNIYQTDLKDYKPCRECASKITISGTGG